MPIAFTIDRERALVLSRAWGELTDRQLLGHARALAAAPAFRPHFGQLADLTGVTSVQVTADGVRELARMPLFGAGSRRAVVVASDAAYGLTRMFDTLRSDQPDRIEIFRSLEAGLAWLGLTQAREDLQAALARAPALPGLD